MTTNNSNHLQWKLRASVALSLTLFLATFPLALSSAAQAPATASTPTPAKASAQTPAKPSTSPASEPTGGPKEGIKVHGHWTIDVRNPDGTLVSHREFENALTTNGAALLARFIGRVNTPFQWFVALTSDAGLTNGPCGDGGPGICTIVEQNDVSFTDAPNRFLNLTVTVPTGNSANANKLVLSGSATTGTSAGQVLTVSTGLTACPAGTNSCPNTTLQVLMTQATLSSPVNTAPGQIVQVTVVISFS
jgi:hypothetical protein